MTASFSMIERSWTFLCPFGCRVTDFESEWEADQAELAHECTSGGSAA